MNKLPKAPLQEAVFEMRWSLQPDSSGLQLTDPEYVFALGKFQDALKDAFPHHQAKFPGDFPYQMLNYQIAHQFWQVGKQWPVVQLGPGIVTVNDTEKNYEWENTYLPNIKKILSALKKSYNHLDFNSLSLRYIDVVHVADYGFTHWKDFVQKNVNFQFDNLFDTRGKLARFNFEQSFILNETGLLNVSFTSGQNNKKEDIFIWQTAVTKQGKVSHKEGLPWLSKAHECASEVFKEICKNDFYASFSK